MTSKKPPTTQKKRASFSETEVERLIELVRDNYEHCYPKSRSTKDVEMQKSTWNYIVKTLNDEFDGDKDIKQCQDKFRNLKSDSKVETQESTK